MLLFLKCYFGESFYLKRLEVCSFKNHKQFLLCSFAALTWSQKFRAITPQFPLFGQACLREGSISSLLSILYTISVRASAIFIEREIIMSKVILPPCSLGMHQPRASFRDNLSKLLYELSWYSSA